MKNVIAIKVSVCVRVCVTNQILVVRDATTLDEIDGERYSYDGLLFKFSLHVAILLQVSYR